MSFEVLLGVYCNANMFLDYWQIVLVCIHYFNCTLSFFIRPDVCLQELRQEVGVLLVLFEKGWIFFDGSRKVVYFMFNLLELDEDSLNDLYFDQFFLLFGATFRFEDYFDVAVFPWLVLFESIFYTVDWEIVILLDQSVEYTSSFFRVATNIG